MQDRSFLSMLRITLCLCLVLPFFGCSSTPKPKAYNLKLSLDPALQGSTVQVDLIGFNESNLARYKTYSVSSYFGDPDDRIRNRSRKKQFVFGQGQPEEQILLSTDPIWQEWLVQEKALYLLILVDLPGIIEDQDSQLDPRRLIVPLDKKAWQGNTDMIEIVISEINIYPLQNFDSKSI